MPAKRKGRPPKIPTVTLTGDELQLIAQKLGYSDHQSFVDDLAMGLIAPIANPSSEPAEIPMEEEVEKPEKIERTGSIEKPRVSWAEEVEGLTEQVLLENPTDGDKAKRILTRDPSEPSMEKAPTVTPTWTDIVKGNRSFGNGPQIQPDCGRSMEKQCAGDPNVQADSKDEKGEEGFEGSAQRQVWADCR